MSPEMNEVLAFVVGFAGIVAVCLGGMWGFVAIIRWIDD